MICSNSGEFLVSLTHIFMQYENFSQIIHHDKPNFDKNKTHKWTSEIAIHLFASDIYIMYTTVSIITQVICPDSCKNCLLEMYTITFNYRVYFILS